jgi:hypothetical protein
MHLTNEQIMEIAQYSFTRLDGAWFMALAKKFGVETAWEMDIEAWKQFSYVFGKHIRKNYIQNPVWPASVTEIMDIFSNVLKIKGREVCVNSNRIVIHTTDCETQKAIAKAGLADCGIATVQSYEGIISGLFDKNINVSVAHTKNLNHGAEYCEIIITKK